MSLIAAMLLVSAQAPATQQASSVAATPGPVVKKTSERKICRTEDADSGSHMSKRVCHTEREWELVAQGVNLTDKSIQTQLPGEH